MKERPILLNGDMVRKTLSGDKTHTRRVIKDVCALDWIAIDKNSFISGKFECPFGQVGDRLWVRETFLPHACETSALYRADLSDTEAAGFAGMYSERGWTPSIHMPRWASRITLEITAVRVERLQDISDEDACHEGFEFTGWRPSYADPDSGGDGDYMTPKDNFIETWDSIYGNWQANPWVWVIEFKVVQSVTVKELLKATSEVLS